MKRAWRALLGIALLGATGGSALAADVAPGWTLRAMPDVPVSFRGTVNMDGAGAQGPGGMMYPGGAGVVGLLAGVLTHAAIVSSTRDAEKERIQRDADGVLGPFREQLASFTYPELGRLARKHAAAVAARDAAAPAPEPRAGWEVESQPVFFMTQDARALVLDNAIQLFAPGTSAPAASLTVRVVSVPLDPENPVLQWSADAGSGSLLKEESARLMAHSLDVAWRHAQPGTAAAGSPQRTLRYAEGGMEKMERAQVLEQLCGRMVVRNLRGWLLSVPTRQAGPASDAGCKTPSQP